MSSKDKKSNKEAPVFTFKLLAILVVACVASGVGTYFYNRPTPAPDPHQGNPNVRKLGKALSKDRFKSYKSSKAQKYQEFKVFPYIKKNQTPIKDCYFGYKGKFKVNPKGYLVMVKFSVSKEGKVAGVSLVPGKTELKEKPILACITKKVEGWKFPPHKLKKAFTMRFPFFFR